MTDSSNDLNFDRATGYTDYNSAPPPEPDVCVHGVPTDEDCDQCYELEADERDE